MIVAPLANGQSTVIVPDNLKIDFEKVCTQYYSSTPSHNSLSGLAWSVHDSTPSRKQEVGTRRYAN